MGNVGYVYEYDIMGNITQIKEGTRKAGTDTTIENAVVKVQYEYDSQNQLVRENNKYLNKTIVYDYDNGGNILSRTEYAYTTAADLSSKTPTDTIVYGYSTSWKDQMISYDGQSITYDAYRVLSRIYYINGSNTNYYYPGVNNRGDVEYIYNINGELVTRYIYDSWGKLIEIQNHTTSADHVGNVNSVRYRGYYYDQETGLYYVGSRYYDPEVGRWINTDNVVSGIGGEISGYNIYGYCYNNPITYSDPNGHYPYKHRPNEYGGSLFGGLKIPFFNDLKEDIKNYDKNNASEEKVLNANYFSSYKGKFVLKTNLERSGSFGILFISRGASQHENPIDEVRHEYGHTVQLAQLGFLKYTLCIGIPSLFEWGSDEEYYRRPWEITADIYGRASRRYPGYEYSGFKYLVNSKEWGVLVWLTIE